MVGADPVSRPATHANARWLTTRWTLLFTAREPNTPKAEAALAELCQLCWPPLYAFIRRRGFARHDAEDLTQAFFVRLLNNRDLERVDPAKGRLRSFLLASLKHFLANEWDRQQTLKRNKGQTPVTLDEGVIESLRDSNMLTPDQQYERQWALTLLETALARLQSEHAEGERARRFPVLKPFLTGDGKEMNYAEAGAILGMTETNVKVTVRNMRRDFREIIRALIAATVDDPAQVEDELRYLMEVLRRTRA